MPSPSWNQIEEQAVLFARDWASAAREQADKQTFWNEFFAIFGISRRLVATFEEPVKGLSQTYKFIDLLWKGKVLVEHKSAGEDLDAAARQAFDYVQDLESVRRGDEAPRYILVSDFQRFVLYDLEPDEQLDLPHFRTRRYHRTAFALENLPLHIRKFAFIPNYQVPTARPQDPLNLKAVNIMATVHDTLKAGGYTGHDLERFLVRVLFCLFAEDTRIFEPESFRLYIENRTHPDGSDLGTRLDELFRTLNTPPERRQRNLDADLKPFPYVNGALFEEKLEFAAFTGPMRQSLLNAANFNWSRISPAIFGALFQEVMKPLERRKIGAHYTSERDILKVIHPLFLDALRAEFDAIQQDRSGRRASRLEDFRKRLTQLKFLDPACGCGNFLVIAYRELRLLELDVLKAQHSTQQTFTAIEVNRLSEVDVDQFYGIEIEEWPARIAEVALWLMDHQSNLRILEAFSQPFYRLPLKKSPHIHIGNALRMDWNNLLPAKECSYILGNPPFVGHQWRSENQVADMELVWGDSGRFGRLDYVTCWYMVAGSYMSLNPGIRSAFVSTNSISQGEQVGILWAALLKKGVQISFAHRTFSWESEARGKAHVHCVIIGFSLRSDADKVIFYYEPKMASPVRTSAQNINPYLVDAPNTILPSRTKPASGIPPMMKGSQPTDGGYLTLDEAEKTNLLLLEPSAEPYIRKYLGGDELLSGTSRYCLWLKSASPSALRKLPQVLKRIGNVRDVRLRSPTKSVRQDAHLPSLFTQDRQPAADYLAVPEVSSQTRNYLPAAFLGPQVIASNKLQIIPGATNYHFGVLSSEVHMAWVKAVSGRLKSDLSYSPSVYNNFPWPQSPTPAQKAKVEELAQAVLDARALYPDSTLAELYDPVLMPPELLKAHQRLDRAVERCYRPEPFASDRERVEFLFALYEKLTAPLLPAPAKQKRRANQPAVRGRNAG
jgi:hypothetical protein